MTLRETRDWLDDREFFYDPERAVRFSVNGGLYVPDGATVPAEGPVVVRLKPAGRRKFVFSLKFEANPVIEADSLEEARAEAFRRMELVSVRDRNGDEDGEYVEQEPMYLEEVTE